MRLCLVYFSPEYMPFYYIILWWAICSREKTPWYSTKLWWLIKDRRCIKTFRFLFFLSNSAGENFHDPSIFNVKIISYDMITDPITKMEKFLVKLNRKKSSCLSLKSSTTQQRSSAWASKLLTAWSKRIFLPGFIGGRNLGSSILQQRHRMHSSWNSWADSIFSRKKQ